MANFEEKQFVTDINQYDVLTGRGSGPYEQPGNIHFREIVATRKIEYLSLNPRDSKMKNQIAKEIINEVRSKGGRFLRKIQVRNKDDGDLYEFVDEDTVMEKAKQALRQNRSGFIKNVMEQSSNESSSSAAALTDSLRAEATKAAASSSAVRKAAPTEPAPMPTPALSSSSINFFGPTDNTKPAAATSTSGGGRGGIDDDDFNVNVGTLDFTGITGPPPDPTTPEEWEAFHAYWSDGNEPNRRLWDQLQAQQQRLQHQQQVNHQRQQQHFQPQQQQQHHQQVYQIPENSASSSHYYPISEQGLWDQITQQQQQQQQQQRQQLPVTPVANNMSSMVNSSTAPALPLPKHGLADMSTNGPGRIHNDLAAASAATGTNAVGMGGGGGGAQLTNQDRIQNQQELLNYLFQQQQNLQQNFAGSASNHRQVPHQPVYQQQTAAAAAAAVPPPGDARTNSDNSNDMAVMNAYMAQLEQQMMFENGKEGGTFGHDLSDSTGRLFHAFEEADSQYRSRTNVTTVSTKGGEQSNNFSKSASEAATAKRQMRRGMSVGSGGSESQGSDQDHDSFFSGIKDMSLPSMSIGEVSDFGKQSVGNKSGTGGSIDILKQVMESAVERAAGVEERVQEVVATVPSQRPTPAAPSINPTPAKRRAKGSKRRSLSSYYREVNAAVAASNGKQSVGEFDASEANDSNSTTGSSDRIDAMSCSLQSMSLSEDFPSMRRQSS